MDSVVVWGILEDSIYPSSYLSFLNSGNASTLSIAPYSSTNDNKSTLRQETITSPQLGGWKRQVHWSYKRKCEEESRVKRKKATVMSTQWFLQKIPLFLSPALFTIWLWQRPELASLLLSLRVWRIGPALNLTLEILNSFTNKDATLQESCSVF